MPGMMKIISVVLPILIAVHAIRLYDSLGINKDLGPNKPQGCALIASDILGVEDLVQYRPGILIGTSKAEAGSLTNGMAATMFARRNPFAFLEPNFACLKQI
mmetsp:Transcript_20607/g.40481  ORF Transcript_20607/g.40481 Transcript_20607/m.40481 type:complete len:102 (+) Transcript_20607:218-523(+)